MKINSLINHHFNYYIEYTIQLENYYLLNSRVMLLLPAGRATVVELILKLIALNLSAKLLEHQYLT